MSSDRSSLQNVEHTESSAGLQSSQGKKICSCLNIKYFYHNLVKIFLSYLYYFQFEKRVAASVTSLYYRSKQNPEEASLHLNNTIGKLQENLQDPKGKGKGKGKKSPSFLASQSPQTETQQLSPQYSSQSLASGGQETAVWKASSMSTPQKYLESPSSSLMTGSEDKIAPQEKKTLREENSSQKMETDSSEEDQEEEPLEEESKKESEGPAEVTEEEEEKETREEPDTTSQRVPTPTDEEIDHLLTEEEEDMELKKKKQMEELRQEKLKKFEEREELRQEKLLKKMEEVEELRRQKMIQAAAKSPQPDQTVQQTAKPSLKRVSQPSPAGSSSNSPSVKRKMTKICTPEMVEDEDEDGKEEFCVTVGKFYKARDKLFQAGVITAHDTVAGFLSKMACAGKEYFLHMLLPSLNYQTKLLNVNYLYSLVGQPWKLDTGEAVEKLARKLHQSPQIPAQPQAGAAASGGVKVEKARRPTLQDEADWVWFMGCWRQRKTKMRERLMGVGGKERQR